MVRANFPNILFGNQVQKGAAGPSPPTNPVIYSNLAGFLATPTRFENLVEMASETGPLWGGSYGVSDPITGTGQYGIGNNYGGNNGFSVPPDPQLTTFGIVMNNSTGASTITYQVDAADYMNNYNFGYPPGWEDYLNFGAYAADPGAGLPGAATSWSWDVTIIAQSFSGGAVAFTSGTGVTTQQADFNNNPGTGVGEDVKWFLGRGGTINGGDILELEVAVTASNASGSATAAVTVLVEWV
jgi:hypothetical protein